MSSPPGSPPAMPLGMLDAARRIMQEDEDMFSETCRRDSFCLSCNRAYCSYCCFCHHVHLFDLSVIAKIDLDAGGRPVIPTHTAGPTGFRIQSCFAEGMAAQDYTTRLARDAFCLHCGKAFPADVCTHHDHADEGLSDAVVRVVEHGGRRCVVCAGTESWTSHMDEALGDPVHVGEDEQGRYCELLPVLKIKPGTCRGCGARGPYPPATHCSHACVQTHHREIDERRRRRQARHAALGQGSKGNADALSVEP